MFGRDPEPVELEIDDHGKPHSVRMRRWINPGGGSFGLVECGGVLESEATFSGYTIPTRGDVGQPSRYNDGSVAKLSAELTVTLG